MVVSGFLTAFGRDQECRLCVAHGGFGEGEGELGNVSDGWVVLLLAEGRRGAAREGGFLEIS